MRTLNFIVAQRDHISPRCTYLCFVSPFAGESCKSPFGVKVILVAPWNVSANEKTVSSLFSQGLVPLFSDKLSVAKLLLVFLVFPMFPITSSCSPATSFISIAVFSLGADNYKCNTYQWKQMGNLKVRYNRSQHKIFIIYKLTYLFVVKDVYKGINNYP